MIQVSVIKSGSGHPARSSVEHYFTSTGVPGAVSLPSRLLTVAIGRQDHHRVPVLNSIFIVTAWYTTIPNLCLHTSHYQYPLYHARARHLSHLTSHSHHCSHLGQGPNISQDWKEIDQSYTSVNSRSSQ
jgi:hypothetical protein